MMNVDVGQFMETLMMPEANLHRRVHNIFRVSPLNITIVGFQWRCDVRAEFQLSNYLITISTAISLQLSIFRGSNVIGQMPCPSLRCCQSFTAAPVTRWFQRDWIAESAAHERRRLDSSGDNSCLTWSMSQPALLLQASKQQLNHIHMIEEAE